MATVQLPNYYKNQQKKMFLTHYTSKNEVYDINNISRRMGKRLRRKLEQDWMEFGNG